MFTPQQLAEVGFTKAVFGGYDMDSVHDVMDPLITDYTTLYKENAVLKSKLRILVEKLEEYRQMEANGGLNAQPQADTEQIIRDAEAKAAAIIREAQARAAAASEETGAAKARAGAFEAENARVAKARQAADSFIASIEADVRQHLELLAALKALDAPAATPAPKPAPKPTPKAVPRQAQRQGSKPAPKPMPKPTSEVPEPSDDIAKEIEQNVEKLVGSVPPASTFDGDSQDTKVMRPLHPESITAKFGDLQFGKNYNPK